MTSTRICLIRHGETDWNRERRIQGHLDMPLNAEGHGQAQGLCQALRAQHFDALYASDLQRARQTAAPVASMLELAINSEKRLRERHYGDFQGLTYDEARARFPAAYASFNSRQVDAMIPGGGESLGEFFARVAAVLGEIAQGHRGQNVLVFTHGGVLDMAHRLASALPLLQRRDFAIGNATINILRYEAAQWHIDTWDQREHLEHSADELPT